MREELEACKDLDEIFLLVKRAVERSLGLHRAGLSLVLRELPHHIGAYYVMGSNVIIMNEALLNALAALARSSVEVKAFAFTILAHEYLHSLGYEDEGRVRELVHRVALESFGPSHPAVAMAYGEIFRLYPELRLLGPGRFGPFRMVRKFDTSSTPYIG